MSSRFLSRSLFDTELFPDHVLSSEDVVTGYEVERVANGRRSAGDYCIPTMTANSATYIQVECDQPRGADMLVIDREHNLVDDIDVSVEISDDEYTTSEVLVTAAVPSVSLPDSVLDGMSCVRTWENALVYLFDFEVAKFWRVNFAAMGAGLVPHLTGVWLGQSWAPTKAARFSGYDDEAGTATAPTFETSFMWRSYGPMVRRSAPQMAFGLRHETEWSELRPHVDAYLSGHPMWVIPDVDRAERAMLAKFSGGDYSIPFAGRFGRELALPLPELQPRARRPY